MCLKKKKFKNYFKLCALIYRKLFGVTSDKYNKVSSGFQNYEFFIQRRLALSIIFVQPTREATYFKITCIKILNTKKKEIMSRIERVKRDLTNDLNNILQNQIEP